MPTSVRRLSVLCPQSWIYGLSVKAASGATPDELERVIERAMRA
jgi:hypothetical protein